MKKTVKEIYEAYLKPREREYKISTVESKYMLKETAFKNSLNLEQMKSFEEYLFLLRQLKHENNEDLIKFVLNYLKKEES